MRIIGIATVAIATAVPNDPLKPTKVFTVARKGYRQD
jgi:hypothetical protein